MDSEQDESIYRLAVECEELFNQRIIEQELQESSRYNFGISPLLTELRDQFITWAAHSGVFAKKSLCLDRRLNKLPDLQDVVVRLLDTLRMMLTQLVAENGNVSDRKTTTFREEERGEEQGSPHVEVLEIIEEALSRLNRLGNALRQASTGGLTSRVKKFAEGLDLTLFDILSHSSVQCLYPGANQPLQIHLSHSMTDTYEKILFLRSRHNSLQTRRSKPPSQLSTIREEQDISTELAPSFVAGMSQPQNSSLDRPQQPRSPPGQFVQSLSSKLSTMDTQILRARLRDSQRGGSRKHKTSSIQINQIDYPPAPKATDQSNMITCDWCFETHPKEHMEGSNWRRHLNNDFEPYLCIAEQCLETCPRYQKFEDWFQHMQTQHGSRWHQEINKQPSWICPLCEGDCEEYTSPQGLLSHIEGSHAQDFTPEQVQMIARQSQTHAPRPLEECPLCCCDIPAETSDLSVRRQSIPAKRHKEPLQRQPSKSARNTAQPGLSGPDQPLDNTSDNSDIENEQTGSLDIPQKPDFAEVVARHVASHLQTLMCVTIRMINLQLNADEALLNVEGDSIDVDDGSDSLWHSSHEEMTHMEETTKMDFSDFTEIDIVPEDEHSFAATPFLTDSNHDWDEVVLNGAISVDKDKFFQKLLASGAYQSHLVDNNLDMATLPRINCSVTLRGAMVESVFTKLKPMFLPQGKMDDLVTRHFIICAFYKYDGKQSLTVPEPVEKVIDFTLTKAKKIFSILVYISLKGAHLYGLMNYVIDREYHDSNLPFRNEQIQEFLPYLPVAEDTKGMRPDQGEWSDDHVYRFIDNQLKFCAPVFSTLIENHDFSEKAILPFIEKDSHTVQAFAEVMKYKIHDSHLDASGLTFPCTDYVAVKKIKLESNQNQDVKISRWEKEVAALRKMRDLDEKHIVNFITAFRLGEDEHYLIFEWADGGNLRNLWEHFPRRLTAELVKDVFGQLLGLARALCKIHNPLDEDISDQHFRHGNLKPENIFRFKDANNSSKLGTLKIGNWDLIKQHNSMTPLRVATPPYFSRTRRYEPPEEGSIRHSKLYVSTSFGKLGRRRTRLIDIWAMGCIWLELLIWLMYGYEELERFNRSLNQEYTDTPSFYEIGEDGNAKVHHVALQWMKHMARDSVCEVGRTALGNLLVLIRDRMLVVNLPPSFEIGGGTPPPRDLRRSFPSSNASTGDSTPRGLTSSMAVAQGTVDAPDSPSTQGNSNFSIAVSPPESSLKPQMRSEKDYRARAKYIRNEMIKITLLVDTVDYWLSGIPCPPPRSTLDDTLGVPPSSIQAGL